MCIRDSSIPLDGSNRVRNITINPNGTGRVRNSIPLDGSNRVRNITINPNGTGRVRNRIPLDGSNRVRNITINPNGTGRVRNSIPLDRSSRVILSRRVLPLPGQVGTVDLPIQDHVLSISLKSFSCCSPAVNNLSKR